MTPIHVVASGVSTAVGKSPLAMTAAFLAGVTRLETSEDHIDSSGEGVVLGRVLPVDAKVGFETRLLGLAGPALRDATERLRGVELPQPVPLLLGVPQGRPGIPALDQDFGKAVVRASETNVVASPTVIGGGHAVGAELVERAANLLSSERPFVVIGAVDSYLRPETLSWLTTARRLAGQTQAGGFVPGEGAAFVLLAHKTALSWIGVRDAPSILGVGRAMEPVPFGAAGVSVGRGISKAVQQALAGVASDAVDIAIGDLNGERSRSEWWGFAQLANGVKLSPTMRTWHTAASMGDLGVATIPTALALALSSVQLRVSPDTNFLAFGSSDSGQCGALLVAGANP